MQLGCICLLTEKSRGQMLSTQKDTLIPRYPEGGQRVGRHFASTKEPMSGLSVQPGVWHYKTATGSQRVC